MTNGCKSTPRMVWHEAMENPPSPCAGICQIEEATGTCAGCHRTLSEIAAWPTLSAKAKYAVLASLAARAAQ